MDSPVTLRLDTEMQRKIARVAKRRGISKSEVIRQALKSWPELDERECSPYELVADIIGIAHGGDPGLSANTGRKFKAILHEKRKQS